MIFKLVEFILSITNRFPLAFTSVCLWVILLTFNVFSHPKFFTYVQLPASILHFNSVAIKITWLAIPIFITLTLVKEIYFEKYSPYWFYFCGCVLVFLYSLNITLLKDLVADTVLIRQEFIALLTCSILAISVLPFFRLSIRSFWQFNNILCIKVIKTFFYSLSITIGLNLLLFILDSIIVFSIPFWCYQLIFIWFFALFGNIYFLSQIPKNVVKFEEDTPFPTFYYIFANLYLLPLTVFSIIGFYCYLIYCATHHIWPHMFSVIIYIICLGLSFFLILQFELLITKRAHPLIKLFLKYFYPLMLPLTLAYFIRITVFWKLDGITEFWFVIWMVLLWAILMCTYFIFSQRRDIRIMPLSIMLLCLIMTFTPVRPFNIAIKSHTHRFVDFCHTQQLIINNTFDFNATQDFSPENRAEFISQLNFFNKRGRIRLLAPYYPYPISASSLTLKRISLDFGLENL